MGEGKRFISLDKKEASSKTYLLSHNGTYVFSFCNGAFGSKWCGLWHNDLKFLDYFAVKVGESWLSPKSFTGMDYNGLTADLHYDVGHKVTQRICVSDGHIVVRVKADKTSDFEFEPGVDIRHRDQDVHHTEYSQYKRKALFVKNGLGKLRFIVKNLDYENIEDLGKHFPGNYANEMGYDWDEGEQERFVPWRIKTRGKNADFHITIHPSKPTGFQETKKRVRSEIRKHSKEWVDSAAISHFLTQVKGGPAFMAGFPYFNEFWTRDFLWMAKPLSDAGFREEVRSALKLIGDSQLTNGAIPNIVGRHPSSENADSTPLWIVALDELKVNHKGLKDALKFGEKKLDSLIDHPPKLTWMDTEYRGKALEIQSLWVEAFRRGSKMLQKPKYLELSVNLWNSIVENYMVDGILKDSLEGPYIFTANALVPVMFGQTSLGQGQRILNKAKNELMTPWGIKAVSKSESHNPEKYHQRVWGLTTYWALESFDNKTRRELLKNYEKNRSSRTLYGFPETISGGQPLGATHQLWSVAFLPKVRKEVLNESTHVNE